MLDVSEVWAHVPPEVQRPESVTVDGKGGVTLATFNSLQAYALAQADQHLQSRFALALPNPIPTGTPLRMALSQLVAAYVLRRFQAYQALAKDLFSNAFATLDEWAGLYLRQQGWVAGPEFVEDGFDAEFPRW